MPVVVTIITALWMFGPPRRVLHLVNIPDVRHYILAIQHVIAAIQRLVLAIQDYVLTIRRHILKIQAKPVGLRTMVNSNRRTASAADLERDLRSWKWTFIPGYFPIDMSWSGAELGWWAHPQQIDTLVEEHILFWQRQVRRPRRDDHAFLD